MKIIYIIFLSCILVTNLDAITISELESYAHTLQEYPDSDNQDWHRPDFTSVYKANREPFYRRLLDKVGIAISPWSASYLMQLLDNLTAIHEHELTQRNIRSIVPKVDADIVVWGNLQGAFHSFIRDLKKLVDLHILSSDLKLYDNKYLVFNGNVINGSAYNMQTLIVVLELMRKNPGKVFYIRGFYEQLNQIQQTGLYQQVHMTRLGDTLLHKVETFFNTLPVALYVMQDYVNGIRIDGGLFDQADNARRTFESFSTMEANKQVNVLASIAVSHEYSDTVGLKLIADSPLKWTLFSSPTGVNRRLHEFFFDAFAVITIGPYIKLWTISLYSRDVRQNKKFGAPTSYNLVTGRLISGRSLDFFDHKERSVLKDQVNELTKKIEYLNEQCKRAQEQSTQQAQKKETVAQEQKNEKELIAANEKPISSLQNNILVVGCTLDLSKTMRNQGISVQGGILGKIRELNKIANAKLKYKAIFLDDADEPKLARNNVHTLLTNFKADILLSPTGTQTLLAYLDQVQKGDILVLFPIAGALEFRNANLKNIIHFRPSYTQEIQVMTNYIVEKFHPAKCAILHQNDEMGIMPKEMAKAILVRSHVENVLELPYEHNVLNFTEQVAKMRDFNPDTIAFIGTSIAIQKFIRQMGVEFFVGKYLYGISDLGELQFRSFMKAKGLDFYISSVVPNPLTSDLALVREFRTIASKDNVLVDTFALEGYINASIMDYVMKHIEGDITKQKIIDAAEKIKNVDLGGIILDFNAERRELSNNVWIAKSSDEKWVKVALQPLELPVVPQGVPKEEKHELVEKDKKKASDEQQKEIGNDKTKEAKQREDLNTSPLLSLHGNTLLIGSTMDLSSSLKGLSQMYLQGIRLGISEVNERGGLKGGISLKLIVSDDQSIPAKARENILDLLDKEKIDLIVSPVGPALSAYFDLIKDERILVLFPANGSVSARKSEYRNMIHYVMASDKVDQAVTVYILKHFPGIKKVVMFSQTNVVGKDPMETVVKVLKKYSVDYITVDYERNDFNFDSQAKEIIDFNPDALGIWANNNVAEGIINRLGVENTFNKVLFGRSGLLNDSFVAFLKEKGLIMSISAVFPDPKYDDSDITKEFKKAALKAKNVPMQYVVLLGYFYIRLLEYVLNNIEQPFTREKIIKAFEGMENFNFKGILLNFNPDRRELESDLWIYSPDSNETPWHKVNIRDLD